ncbi:predicted protein [Micromonas commoda]|uniref:Uncharacterized protein n=1 Tax=Micromonas commoda (strain RCC299 / NOUM17 / CCMP2709) TaxID=296587 RepID=C1FFL7_MICCC|nr:predicted protein [Micromonas commoda]ACO69394.1 predicted protein [Micromonas commoda]|eukprot:XP_002508136.1 predicted protein [Micromonas commoda]
MAAAAMPELGESLDPWTEDDPENFDLDGFAAEFYGDASERRMRHLRDQLSSLRDLAESEQRQNVFAHYESFIRVSREISRLQGQVGKLREMVQVPSDVVETLVADARSHQDDAHEDEDEASATLRRAEERAVASARAVTDGGVDGTLGTLGGRRRADDLVGDDGVATGDARRAAKLRDQLEESLSGREVFAALEAIEEGTRLLRSMRDDVAARGGGRRGKTSRTFGGDEDAKRGAPEGRRPDRVASVSTVDRTPEEPRSGSPSLGETRANPLFAATRHRAATAPSAPSAPGDDSNDDSKGDTAGAEPAAIQNLARALAESRRTALDALMDTLVDPHETKARRDAAADSLRRAGASAAAARRVADAELATARSETKRLAETEKGAGFALEACEATFRALRVAFVHVDDVEGAEGGAEGAEGGAEWGAEGGAEGAAFIAERVRDETSRLLHLVAERSLGRWERAASLSEACAAVLACVRHVDAFVADASSSRRRGGTSIAEGLLDAVQAHPGINGAMKRVLDAATEAFIADDGETDGVGSSGGWIDAGERWLETHAWEDLRTLCELGVAD